MKITRRQLRRIIKEAASPSNDELLDVIAEMGYDLNFPLTMDSNQTAIRDALAGYPGEFTYDQIVGAVTKAGGEL